MTGAERFVLTRVDILHATAPRQSTVTVSIDVRHLRSPGDRGLRVEVDRITMGCTLTSARHIQSLIYPAPDSTMPPLLRMMRGDHGDYELREAGAFTRFSIRVPVGHVCEVVS